MELIIKKLPEVNNTQTICLNMIVKNESKIITRMFDAVIDIIDCYCICDTGSTDDTVNIITDYFFKKGITGKIIHEPFKNFAHNRNVALQGCKGMSDYVLLLDADMILKVTALFDKNALTQDFYYLFQGNDNFYYQNVRLVRNNGLFTYVGVTHEYLSTPTNSIGGKVFPKNEIFINDIGDGGSKSDKFKRDIALLEQGLEYEPGNTRYVFYLGNSYRDFGSHDKAIETFTKLLKMNGWVQEKYCACYSIGNIYHKKDDTPNALKYWLKTSEYDNERIEGIAKAMDLYRNMDDNLMVNLLYHKYKGYKRNLAEGKLFVEQDKYQDMIEYNNSISAYYTNDKESGYTCCKQILLNGVINMGLLKLTMDNMCFYTDFIKNDTSEDLPQFFKKIDRLLGLKKTENKVWITLNDKLNNKIGDGFSMKELIDATSNANNKMTLKDVYQKIKQFRIDGKSTEAMNLYNLINKDDPSYADYFWQLEYEYSVFAYYIGIRNINEQVVTIMNKCHDESILTSVLENMKFYPDILKADKTYDFTHSLKHTLNDVEYNFNSSSSCIIPYNDGYLLNVRLVNYLIDKSGNYINCDKHIISMYKTIKLTQDFQSISEKLIDLDYVDRRYIGIEDVRIFREKDQEKILLTGTSCHKENIIGVACGVYATTNDDLMHIMTSQDIKPAFNLNSGCEKNWTYVNYKGETHMIYSWFPLKICKVNSETSLLELIEERTMPSIFKNARGSSCGIRYTNELNQSEVCQNESWFVMHLVSYEKPRYYYHMLAVFDDKMNLLRYSAPFKFEGENIEYCIGLVVEADRVIIPYSTMDRTTKVAVYDKKYIESKMILIMTCY